MEITKYIISWEIDFVEANVNVYQLFEIIYIIFLKKFEIHSH